MIVGCSTWGTPITLERNSASISVCLSLLDGSRKSEGETSICLSVNYHGSLMPSNLVFWSTDPPATNLLHQHYSDRNHVAWDWKIEVYVFYLDALCYKNKGSRWTCFNNWWWSMGCITCSGREGLSSSIYIEHFRPPDYKRCVSFIGMYRVQINEEKTSSWLQEACNLCLILSYDIYIYIYSYARITFAKLASAIIFWSSKSINKCRLLNKIRMKIAKKFQNLLNYM